MSKTSENQNTGMKKESVAELTKETLKGWLHEEGSTPDSYWTQADQQMTKLYSFEAGNGDRLGALLNFHIRGMQALRSVIEFWEETKDERSKWDSNAGKHFTWRGYDPGADVINRGLRTHLNCMSSLAEPYGTGSVNPTLQWFKNAAGPNEHSTWPNGARWRELNNWVQATAVPYSGLDSTSFNNGWYAKRVDQFFKEHMLANGFTMNSMGIMTDEAGNAIQVPIGDAELGAQGVHMGGYVGDGVGEDNIEFDEALNVIQEETDEKDKTQIDPIPHGSVLDEVIDPIYNFILTDKSLLVDKLRADVWRFEEQGPNRRTKHQIPIKKTIDALFSETPSDDPKVGNMQRNILEKLMRFTPGNTRQADRVVRARVVEEFDTMKTTAEMIKLLVVLGGKPAAQVFGQESTNQTDNAAGKIGRTRPPLWILDVLKKTEETLGHRTQMQGYPTTIDPIQMTHTEFEHWKQLDAYVRNPNTFKPNLPNLTKEEITTISSKIKENEEATLDNIEFSPSTRLAREDSLKGIHWERIKECIEKVAEAGRAIVQAAKKKETIEDLTKNNPYAAKIFYALEFRWSAAVEAVRAKATELGVDGDPAYQPTERSAEKTARTTIRAKITEKLWQCLETEQYITPNGITRPWKDEAADRANELINLHDKLSAKNLIPKDQESYKTAREEFRTWLGKGLNDILEKEYQITKFANVDVNRDLVLHLDKVIEKMDFAKVKMHLLSQAIRQYIPKAIPLLPEDLSEIGEEQVNQILQRNLDEKDWKRVPTAMSEVATREYVKQRVWTGVGEGLAHSEPKAFARVMSEIIKKAKETTPEGKRARACFDYVGEPINGQQQLRVNFDKIAPTLAENCSSSTLDAVLKGAQNGVARFLARPNETNLECNWHRSNQNLTSTVTIENQTVEFIIRNYRKHGLIPCEETRTSQPITTKENIGTKTENLQQTLEPLQQTGHAR